MSTTTVSQTSNPTLNGAPTGAEYWWRTSGQDLANMMKEANYPEEIKQKFLDFYKQTVCPQLGSEPTAKSAKSGLGWDGSPFEYSFELKNTSASEAVRFAGDFGNLSPSEDDEAGPLVSRGPHKIVEQFVGRTADFDDAWYKSLLQFFDQSHQPKSKQLELVAKAGHQTPIVIGFDLYSKAPSNPNALPFMGKVYFPPCHYAAAKGISRWDAISEAIHQLPDVASYPNVTKSLNIIAEYLATKPESWKDGARYLATDFTKAGKARLKIYLRYPGESFDEIWDYYTLGGRIPAMEEDKAMFKDIIDFTQPGGQTAAVNSDLHFTNFRRKMTCIYFSLSPNNATPAPKIGIYPANYAANDAVIAKGIDQWLQKYNWPLPKRALRSRREVYSHIEN